MMRDLLRPLVALTAAAVLLTGCSGGDDKKSESPSGGDGNNSSPTPTAPELPSFDPPKAFAAVAALPYSRAGQTMEFNPGKAGMVGKTALYANKTGIAGRSIDGGVAWQVPAKEAESTTVIDYAQPMAVQLDGKEVIATVYVQSVEAGGTQKAHSQLSYQWIDPADGKLLAGVAIDLTPVIGPGSSGGRLSSTVYDAATGQIAAGVGVQSGEGTGKYNVVTGYADPAGKQGTVIPAITPAGVLDGTVVGAKGHGQEGGKEMSIVVADGPTAAIKKTIPVPTMNYLRPAAGGAKHAYLQGSGYVEDSEYDGHHIASMYAVDLASGTVTETKAPNSKNGIEYSCYADQVGAVVCNGADDITAADEILGFDDATGKKSWGYTSASANRVVPKVTAVYNGAVYGMADALPAVLDAKTGQDVPVPTATPGSTPTGDTGSTGDQGGWGDLSLMYGQAKSPEMVSKYGSTYLLNPGDKAPTDTERVLVVQKATS